MENKPPQVENDNNNDNDALTPQNSDNTQTEHAVAQTSKRSPRKPWIVGLIVVVLVAAAGFIWYNSSKSSDTKNDNVASQDDSEEAKTGYEITDIGDGMSRYTNNDLGFSFDFPTRIHGDKACAVNNDLTDSEDNPLPVKGYISKMGTVDMTVLSGDNKFTIAQVEAPYFTNSEYGPDGTSYFSTCEMAKVTQELLDANDNDDDSGSKYIASEDQSWQVYKVDSESEIASLVQELDGLAPVKKGSKVSYKLGKLKDGHQDVAFDYETDAVVFGGGAAQTWYFPDQKLLAHIFIGQSSSYEKPDKSGMYSDTIYDTFKAL